MEIKEAIHFGGEYPPPKDFLGANTMWILIAPDRVESYIVQNKRKFGEFCDYRILAEGPLLTPKQVRRLTGYVLTPEAHYNGRPMFQRLPSVPNFALRLWREGLVLDVLVDLHNPGWEFHCGSERYMNWNWVGEELVSLAKELFPELASPNPKSIWKQGAIKAIKDRATTHNGE